MSNSPKKNGKGRRFDPQSVSRQKPLKFILKTVPPDSRYFVFGVYLALAAMVFAVYGQTLGHEFINYDDNLYVYSNSLVTSTPTFAGVLKIFCQKEVGLWSPLVTISHLLDWQLFGSWAGGHHLTNLLLHLASTILLFLILRQMTGTLWRSALVAALFAVHPLRVESVAWIAERKDVLSGLFFMLTLGSYLHYLRQPKSWGRYALLILMFALSLMCKPMLVTLPFLLLLLDYWPLNRLLRSAPPSFNWDVIREKIPLFVMTIALCVITVTGNTAPPDPNPIPFTVRVGLIPVWLVTYLWQMIWPFGLAVIYPHPENLFSWWPAALLLWGLLTFGCFLLRRKHPYLWMGWLWNLGMFVPVLGLIQISRHSQADHYNYLPQIGLYIGGVWWVAACTKERPFSPIVLKMGAAAALAFLMIIAFRQTSTWRDSNTLWNYTIQKTRDNSVAHYNLGTAFLEAKQPAAAIVEFHEALRISPSDFETHSNIGVMLAAQGKIDEAITEFREALRLNPANVPTHNNLALALAGKGERAAAIAEYREALHINPDYVVAHDNLGVELFAQGQVDAAVAEYEEALRIDPNFESANYNLATALNQQGLKEKAFFHLKKTLSINPSNAKAHNNLGALLQDQKKTPEAIAEYRQALRLVPDFAQTHFNLGKIFLEQGQMEEAITEFRETLRIDPKYAAAQNNLGHCLLRTGAPSEAFHHYEEALELQPDNPLFLNDLAWALATAPQRSFRDGKRAVELATLANQATKNGAPVILCTLAAAYAQAGKFSKAVATIEAALRLAQGQTALTADLQHDLKLYQSGKSFGSD